MELFCKNEIYKNNNDIHCVSCAAYDISKKKFMDEAQVDN